jgi:transcriptional regulator with XRE-family HTH domain
MKPHPLICQLAEERHALDLSVEAVAAEAGMSRRTINAFDSGTNDPRLSSLEAYAAALGFAVALVRIHEKSCRECNETKLVTAFGRDNRTRDGIATRCGACVAANPAPLHRRLEVAA